MGIQGCFFVSLYPVHMEGHHTHTEARARTYTLFHLRVLCEWAAMNGRILTFDFPRGKGEMPRAQTGRFVRWKVLKVLQIRILSLNVCAHVVSCPDEESGMCLLLLQRHDFTYVVLMDPRRWRSKKTSYIAQEVVHPPAIAQRPVGSGMQQQPRNQPINDGEGDQSPPVPSQPEKGNH